MATPADARDETHTYPLNTLDKEAAPAPGGVVGALEEEDRQDKIDNASAPTRDASSDAEMAPPVYRLYKRRWAGLAGLSLVNLVLGMNGVWFAAVFDQTRTYFGITTGQVNWLTNTQNILVIVFGFFVPWIIQKIGVKYCCWLGALIGTLGCWLRVAGTANPSKGYPLLVIGHALFGIGTPLVGTIGPKWVEIFFDEKGRTTATAVYSMSIILGQLVGQVLSPAFVVVSSDTRFGLLVNSAISTILCLTCFLVFSAPPTPPTFTASTETLPFFPVFRMLLGLGSSPSSDTASEVSGRERISRRERLDFWIIAFCYMLIASALISLETFIGQITLPFGYDSTTAGFMGAAVIAAGIIAAVSISPLFDKVFTHPRSMGLALKIGASAVAITFIGLIFAVKRDNAGGLYGLFVVMGVCGFSLSPFALELGSELTRNPEATTMILNNLTAVWAIVSVEVIGALASPVDESLRNGLVFLAVTTSVAGGLSWVLRGTQKRRETDVRKRAEL